MRVACIQGCAGDDMAANLDVVERAVREAAAGGATFITTPENVALMAEDRDSLFAQTPTEEAHPAVARFAQLAADTKSWLLAGSIAVRSDDDRLSNRSFLFGPDGRIVATYDKIHMFDVELPGGESYRESKNYRPGGRAVVSELPHARLGMTICYDIRFPHLYRSLAAAEVDIITVPSAFTKVTGKAHWHILLRARAIETGAFVVAPAQVGRHPAKRETYGHSLVVTPWGDVIMDAGRGTGVFFADLDLSAVSRARASVPAWRAAPEFKVPEPAGDS